MTTQVSIWMVAATTTAAVVCGCTYALQPRSVAPSGTSTTSTPGASQTLPTAEVKPAAGGVRSADSAPNSAPNSGASPGSNPGARLDPALDPGSDTHPRTSVTAPEKSTSNADKTNARGTIPEDMQKSRNAVRSIEQCVVRMAIVNTQDDSQLNVRSQPQKAEGNILHTVKNGTFLTIVAEQGTWFSINEPVVGWVAKKQTDHTCNQKLEQLTFASGGTSMAIADRFIGTGSHRYRLGARQGQTLSLKSLNGPRPALLAPSGKTLAELDRDPSWTGTLPETGDYLLELASNFKGYKYEFMVEIQ